MEKRAGILLPLFAVPGNQGIGDLGQKTLIMIDELAKAGYTLWSMLPLNVIQKDNSPYSAASFYAGDPIYINIDRLAEMGLLTQSSIVNCNKFKSFVDYDTVRSFKEPYFQRAFKAFRKNYSRFKAEFEQFKKEAFWLNSWTAYEVFRSANDKKGWSQWPASYQNWPEKQEINLRDYVERIFYVQFLQYIFYRQLDEVSQRAKERGVILMQDMPFFSNLDSAEVWFQKKNYMVRPDGTIRLMTGTPPEGPGQPGQVWEKPAYNLDVLKEDNYQTFRKRIDWTTRNFDAVRLLHFKGFDAVWKISEHKKPESGKWAAGPGRELLELIRQDHPSTLFVAEDQGVMKASLRELEQATGIPGMDVLESRMETKLLKHNSAENVVIYSSTVDSPTLEEDYASYTNNHKIALRRFFKKRGYDHRPFHDLVLHYAFDQDAFLVIANISDIMGLKENGRINVPDQPERDNWTWKLKDYKQFPAALAVTTPWIIASGRHPQIAPESAEKEDAAGEEELGEE